MNNFKLIHFVFSVMQTGFVLRKPLTTKEENKYIVGGQVVELRVIDRKLQRSPICFDQWTQKEAEVVCKILAQRYVGLKIFNTFSTFKVV